MFEGFVGQDDIKNMLKDLVKYTRVCGVCMPHTLFVAAPGQGKTTLANMVAKELSDHVINTFAPTLNDWNCIKNVMRSLKEGSVWIIDEVHALGVDIQEKLYDVMLQFNYTDGDERVELPQFTLLACTTDPQLMLRPFMDRFANTMTFNNYSVDELSDYVMKAFVEGMIDKDVADKLVNVCARNPRKIKAMFKKIECYHIAHEVKHWNMTEFNKFLNYIGLDNNGFTKLQVAYINTLKQHKALSLQMISAIMGLRPGVVSQIIEPDLMAFGVINIGANGRSLKENVCSL